MSPRGLLDLRQVVGCGVRKEPGYTWAPATLTLSTQEPSGGKPVARIFLAGFVNDVLTVAVVSSKLVIVKPLA